MGIFKTGEKKNYHGQSNSQFNLGKLFIGRILIRQTPHKSNARRGTIFERCYIQDFRIEMRLVVYGHWVTAVGEIKNNLVSDPWIEHVTF